jgi:methylated-DNA-[protein]-cysteine S-methyltransferase
MFDVTVDFPRMKVAVKTRDEHVVEIRYLPLASPSIAPRNALAARAASRLEAYLADPDARFDLPLAVEGTPFQLKLWRALCEIPRGRTRTYGDLAKELNGEARSVGQACGDNRLPVVIPCHRVVAAEGIGGFAHASGGYLLEAKRWLLAHELGADPFELTP